ncbi:MAG: EAL domain-containing protein [Terracidiphilus sp.]|nr:EAL domain-containing protein [Terracidiphilus sp.]
MLQYQTDNPTKQKNMYPWTRKTTAIRIRDVYAAISIIGIFVLSGCFCLNILVRELILRSAQNRLLDLCQDSISRSDHIVNDAIQELTAMNRSSMPRCSPENLDALRERIFKTGMLQDAGWFEGDQIRCSSQVTQTLNGAIDLELVAKLRNNTRLYRSNTHFSIQQRPTVIVRMDDAYVNIGVLAQEFEGPSWVEFSATIADIRGYYAGAPDPQATWIFTSPGKYRHNGRVYATACSTQNSICHTAAVPISHLLRREWMPPAVGIVCGGVMGGMLGCAILLFYLRRKTLESQLYRAIRKNRIYLEYQPIVRISDQRIVGAEALCRWKDESGVQVPPQKFIRIAEQKLWINALTKLVFSKAFEECGELLRQNPDFTLNVNMSPCCLGSPKLLEELRLMLKAQGVKPESIAIEITESAAAHDSELIAQIQAMRAAGHPIHLDDFGAGYSSLSYLHELRIDAIKIDRAFLLAIGTHSIQVDILPQIISIAQTLNLDVVVEGIETREQEAYLAAISNSLFGQGWLYGRPAGCEQLRAMLASQPERTREEVQA